MLPTGAALGPTTDLGQLSIPSYVLFKMKYYKLVAV
jgi:hypothetical protein